MGNRPIIAAFREAHIARSGRVMEAPSASRDGHASLAITTPERTLFVSSAWRMDAREHCLVCGRSVLVLGPGVTCSEEPAVQVQSRSRWMEASS
jgi:hypothetical protein